MAGRATLTATQAATQTTRLRDVRPELGQAYLAALHRWMGDPKLLLLGLPIITEGYRSAAVQAAYYAQGRELLPELNRLRGLAGLEPFAAYSGEARRIITYKRAGTSNHNKYPSEAIDVALLQADGSMRWDAGALLLLSHLMLYANKRIVWGGDFNHNGRTDDERLHDWPHFELTG